MDTKTATQNSLLIVLFSQLSSVLKTTVSGSIPEFPLVILLGMIAAGILGSEAGRRICSRADEHQATLLFEWAMILVMLVSVYNIYNFSG